VIWTLLVLPGLWPAWPWFVRPDTAAQADPLKFILHHLGLVACVLLALVLSFTPLRVLWPKSEIAQALNRHRRLVGVGAFAYALLHTYQQTQFQDAFDAHVSSVRQGLASGYLVKREAGEVVAAHVAALAEAVAQELLGG
jgi:DMSO/TMAO reductase YedYZ heme-binding membrane subunit